MLKGVSELTTTEWTQLIEVWHRPVELPQDERTNKAVAKLTRVSLEISPEALITSIRLARCLTAFQDLSLEQPANYDCQTIEANTNSNNGWNIFKGLHRARHGLPPEADNNYFNRAISDSNWPKFLENNPDLVNDLLILMEINHLFSPYRKLAIFSIDRKNPDELTPVEHLVSSTHNSDKSYYPLLKLRCELADQALVAMKAAGMLHENYSGQ